ncbi:tetratricopeptide repeat protein [Streptomyces lateritius]|uniref:tetratricopeptide repeat protein n=1 Tax=Streptomyces lateritius TaxID=67313 RepID=UPI001C8B743D|nr:tetratricopeptide repeat protein [Streptomyces lateritius]MBX9424793.1 sel1 repeat family protein [Streptomyces lateritius]
MVEQLSDVARSVKDLLDSRGDDPTFADRLDESLPALRAAAEAGDISAQNVWGGVLLDVEEDPSAAATWFERTAGRGSAVGRRSLGFLYANGLGVVQDLERAESLFRAAAEAGDGYAQFNLAQLWWGKGDVRTVASLLRSAAEGGLDEAYTPLGDLLVATGQDAEAMRWYLAAIGAGDADDVHGAVEVAKRLTDSQIRRAGEQAGRPSETEAMIGTVRTYR